MVGIASHVSVSHCGIFEIHMWVNRKQEGRADLQIGTYGNHTSIDIMRATSDEIVGNLDSKGYQGVPRIGGEIPDPTVGYLR